MVQFCMQPFDIFLISTGPFALSIGSMLVVGREESNPSLVVGRDVSMHLSLLNESVLYMKVVLEVWQ